MTDDTAQLVAAFHGFDDPLAQFIVLALQASNDPDAEAQAWRDYIVKTVKTVKDAWVAITAAYDLTQWEDKP